MEGNIKENIDMDKFEEMWEVGKAACDPTFLSAESNSDIARMVCK